MSDHLSVEQYESIEDLSPELILEWKSVLDSARSKIPFSDPDWLKMWCRHFGTACNQSVIVVRVEDKLVGVLPFTIKHRFFYRQVSFMGDPQATHTEPTVDAEYIDEVIDAMLNRLGQWKGITFYRLAGLKKNSAFAEKLIRRITDANRIFLKTETISPVVFIGGRSFEEYYRRRVRRNNRNQDKRCLKRLLLLGKLDFRPLQLADIPKVAELHNGRWKKKLDTSGFTKQEAISFYSDLLNDGSDRWSALTLGAYLDRELIAFEYGYQCGGQALMYRSAHNDLLNTYAAGKMTHREIFRRCFEAGLHTIDLGIGYEEHKMEWTDDYETIVTIDFPQKDPLSRFLFLLRLLKGKLRSRLKQSRKLVLFKRNTLGGMKYFLSAEHLHRAGDAFTQSVKRLGLTGYLRSFKKKTRSVKYRLELKGNYLLKAAELKAAESYETRKASLDDAREIGFFMNCSPEHIVRRFFRQEQCFCLERERELLCLAWISTGRGAPRIFDCRFYRRKCREQDVFQLLVDILALLQKQKYSEAELEIEAGSKVIADAAGKAGFKCARP